MRVAAPSVGLTMAGFYGSVRNPRARSLGLPVTGGRRGADRNGRAHDPGQRAGESFLGGEMKVDPAASRGVFAPLAEALDISVEELADSVIQLAESNIVRAINKSRPNVGAIRAASAIVPSRRRPLHAARVAEELGVTKVVVPPHAGVLSAAGLLMSDYVYYRVRTRKLQLADSAMGEVREILAALEAEVDEYLHPSASRERCFRPGVGDVRYVGQAFEVTVPFTDAVARTVDTGGFRPFSERNTTASSSSRNRRTIRWRLFPSGSVRKWRRPPSPISVKVLREAFGRY